MCGTIDGDYQTVMADPSIDLCSFHDYYGPGNQTAYNAWNGLNVRVSQCATLKKPLYIGEMGMHLDDPLIGGSTAVRATYLGKKMTAAFAMQGMVGYVPWQWDSYNHSGDDYNYTVGDPGLAVMTGYAR
jgi:hypothetical protein